MGLVIQQGQARGLFAMVMERLTDKVGQDSPRTMMIADVNMIYNDSGEQV